MHLGLELLEDETRAQLPGLLGDDELPTRLFDPGEVMVAVLRGPLVLDQEPGVSAIVLSWRALEKQQVGTSDAT